MRFSFRTLFGIVLAFSVWLGIEANRLQTLEAEAKRITSYENNLFGPNRISYQRHGPEWLRQMLPGTPLPFFDRPRAINFSSPLTDDRSAEITTRHRRVTHLWFSGGEVTDEGVSYLKNHPTLKELSLRDTRITDRSIRTITTLQSLEVLSLYGTSVSDASVMQLATLSRLRKLNLAKTKVSSDVESELRTKLPGCFVGDF